MIKILIVDDSPTETALLTALFQGERDLMVVGCAKNGREAMTLTEKLKPDIITMDIQMPIMDGLEATRLIMTQFPTPIIVISSTLHDESLRASFLALEAGAVSVQDKPKNLTSPSSLKERNKIIEAVRVMAGLHVIKRRFYTKGVNKHAAALTSIKQYQREYELIVIGASVGGPQALKKIFSHLPADFPIPIVVVQHMSVGFMASFTKWLNDHSALTIKEAENGERLTPGTVYFAPDNTHLVVKRSQTRLSNHLLQGLPVSGFCPSITMLFQSISTVCGRNAMGVLLTGMGSDGAEGLLKMRQAEAHTVIQDANSAVVFGMAGVAQSLNAVDKVIDLEEMAGYLIKVTSSVKEKT